jgi:hypothetical protein
MDLEVFGQESLNWIKLDLGMTQWQAAVNNILNR